MKHIPLRHCAACRAEKDKAHFIRVVRSPDKETVSIDASGKANGRGVYICRETVCVQKAQKSRAIERQFKRQIDSDIYTALLEQVSDA